MALPRAGIREQEPNSGIRATADSFGGSGRAVEQFGKGVMGPMQELALQHEKQQGIIDAVEKESEARLLVEKESEDFYNTYDGDLSKAHEEFEKRISPQLDAIVGGARNKISRQRLQTAIPMVQANAKMGALKWQNDQLDLKQKNTFIDLDNAATTTAEKIIIDTGNHIKAKEIIDSERERLSELLDERMSSPETREAIVKTLQNNSLRLAQTMISTHPVNARKFVDLLVEGNELDKDVVPTLYKMIDDRELKLKNIKAKTFPAIMRGLERTVELGLSPTAENFQEANSVATTPDQVARLQELEEVNRVKQKNIYASEQQIDEKIDYLGRRARKFPEESVELSNEIKALKLLKKEYQTGMKKDPVGFLVSKGALPETNLSGINLLESPDNFAKNYGGTIALNKANIKEYTSQNDAKYLTEDGELKTVVSQTALSAMESQLEGATPKELLLAQTNLSNNDGLEIASQISKNLPGFDYTAYYMSKGGDSAVADKMNTGMLNIKRAKNFNESTAFNTILTAVNDIAEDSIEADQKDSIATSALNYLYSKRDITDKIQEIPESEISAAIRAVSGGREKDTDTGFDDEVNGGTKKVVLPFNVSGSEFSDFFEVANKDDINMLSVSGIEMDQAVDNNVFRLDGVRHVLASKEPGIYSIKNLITGATIQEKGTGNPFLFEYNDKTYQDLIDRRRAAKMATLDEKEQTFIKERALRKEEAAQKRKDKRERSIERMKKQGVM